MNERFENPVIINIFWGLLSMKEEEKQLNTMCKMLVWIKDTEIMKCRKRRVGVSCHDMTLIRLRVSSLHLIKA